MTGLQNADQPRGVGQRGRVMELGPGLHDGSRIGRPRAYDRHFEEFHGAQFPLAPRAVLVRHREAEGHAAQVAAFSQREHITPRLSIRQVEREGQPAPVLGQAQGAGARAAEHLARIVIDEGEDIPCPTKRRPKRTRRNGLGEGDKNGCSWSSPGVAIYDNITQRTLLKAGGSERDNFVYGRTDGKYAVNSPFAEGATGEYLADFLPRPEIGLSDDVGATKWVREKLSA